MRSASPCVHICHGSGAVIRRDPRNAGGKPAKKKRGVRSAAAIAARIERRCLKRSGTAVSTASNLNSHVDPRGITADDSGHSTAECTAVDARVGGDDAPRRERKPRTEGAEPDHDVEGQHAKFTSRCSRHTGDRQARPVRRGSDEVRGLFVQAEIVSRIRGPAVPEGADEDRSIDDPETQRDARQRRKQPQHPVVLHTRDDNVRNRAGQVPQRRRERRIRSVEAVRHGVEPKLRTRFVGLLMNVLSYRFKDDIPNKLAAVERLVHDYENQSTKTSR